MSVFELMKGAAESHLLLSNGLSILCSDMAEVYGKQQVEQKRRYLEGAGRTTSFQHMKGEVKLD